ncbi:transcription termination factor NusA [Fibrobacter sp.]|uniref:transcription termination factor NusA n=1 Tax=Fibrobacter sp. TaxID=35828 RepID=UPI001B166FD2|nr:transcription termination factor NusA [Fibrobacter sp.]MBO5532361.1 transcription termination factor NusA [Fibrobacter sp.]MBS7271764.1 transcription termination factor NusA [Fibrobacter sp.]MCI6436271.1 transcription termination factor NusA [Fibrobacter sp.]MDD5941344.1 transcription termination factor NusA [Fibrobacter sp.]MDD7498107.1 transcription termination factor NusA [Fibrobacter sp.]
MAISKKEPKVNLLEVLKGVVEAKDMDDSVVLNALKEALVTAARKYLHIEKKIDVDFDMETNEVHVYLRVAVVDDYPDYDPNMTAAEVEKLDQGYMLVEEARDFNEDAQAGDFLEMEIPISAFGRQAIQTAKQLLNQQIRDAERQKIMDTYRSRIGSMVSGEVLRLEQSNIIVKLGKQTEAMIPFREQIKRERWEQGNSIKAVIARVEESSKNGAQVILSRANGDFLKELFRQEVPEIYEGTVEIKGVAREPGFRAKIAVYSRDEKIDPVGACVGMKGARVQTIVRELGNERIDIVQWNPDLDVFIQRALTPANVIKQIHVPETRRTVVIISDENLALAIGKNGQNVKLAAELVQRNLDVFGEKEWSEKDDETKAKITSPSVADLNQNRKAAR